MGVAVAAAECGMDRGVKDCEALDRDTWKTLFFGFFLRFAGAESVCEWVSAGRGGR